MATLFEYMYRDGSNYKQWGRAIFAGELTAEQVAQLKGHLDGGEYFIAEQVGLENVREMWTSTYDDDHIWHEFTGIETVDVEATDPRTATEFLAQFLATEWDEQAAQTRLEQWAAALPRGR